MQLQCGFPHGSTSLLASTGTAPRAEQTLRLFAFKSAKQQRSGRGCRACVPTNTQTHKHPTYRNTTR